MDRLQEYMLTGKKVLLLCDALPIDMPQMSPSQRHKPQMDPRMGGQAGAIKGDIAKLLSEVGIIQTNRRCLVK